tara:strand:+ start:6448 stop:6627 length:180 start_codon:yes stop_codon:yes gene_type:complete
VPSVTAWPPIEEDVASTQGDIVTLIELDPETSFKANHPMLSGALEPLSNVFAWLNQKVE